MGILEQQQKRLCQKLAQHIKKTSPELKFVKYDDECVRIFDHNGQKKLKGVYFCDKSNPDVKGEMVATISGIGWQESYYWLPSDNDELIQKNPCIEFYAIPEGAKSFAPNTWDDGEYLYVLSQEGEIQIYWGWWRVAFEWCLNQGIIPDRISKHTHIQGGYILNVYNGDVVRQVKINRSSIAFV